MEINVIGVSLAAFLGGIAIALIGWLEQGTSWDTKKFVASLVRSLVGGIGIAAALDYSGATSPIVYLLAFLSGAGMEVGGNRVAGAIAARRK
jgi:hypothetical protein